MALSVAIGLGATAEFYFEYILGPLDGPGVAEPEPLIGRLHLPTVPNHLVEDAVLVVDAVADGRNVEGCQRIHEAGCQAAESAVAQPRLLLLLDQRIEAEVQRTHRLLGFFVDPEIDQVVGEMRSGEEFRR